MQSQHKAQADARLQQQQLEQQAKELAHRKHDLSQEEARLSSSKLQLEVSVTIISYHLALCIHS